MRAPCHSPPHHPPPGTSVSRFNVLLSRKVKEAGKCVPRGSMNLAGSLRHLSSRILAPPQASNFSSLYENEASGTFLPISQSCLKIKTDCLGKHFTNCKIQRPSLEGNIKGLNPIHLLLSRLQKWPQSFAALPINGEVLLLSGTWAEPMTCSGQQNAGLALCES